jgi:hypothetical protein
MSDIKSSEEYPVERAAASILRKKIHNVPPDSRTDLFMLMFYETRYLSNSILSV